MNERIIRSNRKTLALEMKGTELLVRAPLRMPESEILRFIEKNRTWIEKHRIEAEQRALKTASLPQLTMDDLQSLADQALRVIPERVRYFAPLVGVTYGRITIRNQRSKWGSCSAKGNLNFNCLLMLAPPEVLDSVVVHELCHRKEMNHSERFYAEVYRVYPEYDRWNQWLKKNGAELMARMTG